MENISQWAYYFTVQEWIIWKKKFTDQNILDRHNHLNATVGFLQMEKDSLRTAYYFSWIFFPIWIILTIVQIVCFILYNGRLHPLARIINESKVDDTGKSKYWIYLHYLWHKSKLKYLYKFYCRLLHRRRTMFWLSVKAIKMPAFDLNHGNVQSKAKQICFSFSNKIIHVNFISWDIIFVFTYFNIKVLCILRARWC